MLPVFYLMSPFLKNLNITLSFLEHKHLSFQFCVPQLLLPVDTVLCGYLVSFPQPQLPAGSLSAAMAPSSSFPPSGQPWVPRTVGVSA